MNRASQNRRPTRQAGMSLVEVTVSMLISSIILIGMSAPMYLALESTDESATPHAAALRSARALADLANELQFALTVPLQSSLNCTYTVKDRDGDLSNETIRIAWSGAPGAPLTRQVNGGAAATVVEDVRSFALSYQTSGSQLAWVQMRLQVGSDTRGGMQTITRMANRP